MTVGVAAPRTQAAPARPMPASVRPKRRVWLLILSLLSMVVCAGAFALVYLRSDARVQVLGVARPLAAGQAITAADLRVVRIMPDAALELVSAHGASQVIGRTAVLPLAKGSLLTKNQLGPAAWPPKEQAVVAVPVKAGRLAAGVTPGVRVLVIPVAKEGDTQRAPSSGEKPEPVAATVVRVTDGIDGSGTTEVSLLVSRQDVVTVAGSSGDVSIAVAQG